MLTMARVLILVLIVGSTAMPKSSALAQDDPCPEPNGAAENACHLDPDVQVQGFITGLEDVDLYALDVAQGANVRVDMVPPGNYQVSIARANGDIVAEPRGEGVAPRQIRAQ